MNKKTESKREPKSARLTMMNNFRSSEEQRQRILDLAEACKMKPSQYMLARCLNFKPVARLAPIEEATYKELVSINTILRMVNSRIRNMSAGERNTFFRSHEWLVEILGKIAMVIGPLEHAIKMLSFSNKELLRTSNNQAGKEKA